MRGRFSWTDGNLNVIAYPASLWLRRHLTAALLCTPDRVRRSRRALEETNRSNRITRWRLSAAVNWMSALRRAAAELFRHLVRTGRAATLFSETTVPRCCLSLRRPSRTRTCPARHKHTVQLKRVVTCDMTLFSFAASRWYLILHRTDGTVIPPIPAGGGGVLGGKGCFHWLVERPLTQQGVQVCGAKFFLWWRFLKGKEKKKKKQGRSQRQSRFKGTFPKRSWCKTCKVKDVDPHLKLCNARTS